jgi:hypothetical protein
MGHLGHYTLLSQWRLPVRRTCERKKPDSAAHERRDSTNQIDQIFT